MYLALKKCKNKCKIFKITEIAPSSIGFRLNSTCYTVDTPLYNSAKTEFKENLS